MPFMNAYLAQYLAERALELESRGAQEGEREIEAVIPRVNGQLHPLLAMYRRSVLPGLEGTLGEGCLKVQQWTSGLAANYVTGEELSRASGLPPEQLVFNMNRPEDYQAAQSHFEQNNK
ncbi:molybdopterin-guanine dinucleotide biosynthesis protein MobA [compost metagenome]